MIMFPFSANLDSLGRSLLEQSHRVMRIHDMTFEERPLGQRLVSYETYDQSESDEET